MKTILSVLLFTLFLFGQDIIETTAGVVYSGKIISTDSTHVLFLPDKSPYEQKVPCKAINRAIKSDRTVVYADGKFVTGENPQISRDEYEALLTKPQKPVPQSHPESTAPAVSIPSMIFCLGTGFCSDGVILVDVYLMKNLSKHSSINIEISSMEEFQLCVFGPCGPPENGVGVRILYAPYIQSQYARLSSGIGAGFSTYPYFEGINLPIHLDLMVFLYKNSGVFLRGLYCINNKKEMTGLTIGWALKN